MGCEVTAGGDSSQPRSGDAPGTSSVNPFTANPGTAGMGNPSLFKIYNKKLSQLFVQ